MESNKLSTINTTLYLAIFLFVSATLWLFYLLLNNLGPDSHSAQIWSSAYQVIAWFGAICGLYFANLWGGTKSVVGRANLAFTIGLLGQSFGQSVFSYFYFQGIEVPYPSIADIGFFGSIPFYIYGIFLLSKLSGAKLSFRSTLSKVVALFIPLFILGDSYYIFLKDYVFDWSQPIVILLDFGYPFGQAIFISLAITAYLLSKNYLGGLMRKPILFFMIALFIQFAADYLFLFQVSRDIYVGGLEVDFLYLLAYFAMTFSLIKLGSTFYKITNS